MVALRPPDRLSKKRLAADSSDLIKYINFAVPAQNNVAKFESVDIDTPKEIAPELKARKSIGCQKIKLLC